jgi:hypothetical protein
LYVIFLPITHYFIELQKHKGKGGREAAKVPCEFYISSPPGQAVANEKKLGLMPSKSVNCTLLSSVAAGT